VTSQPHLNIIIVFIKHKTHEKDKTKLDKQGVALTDRT